MSIFIVHFALNFRYLLSSSLITRRAGRSLAMGEDLEMPPLASNGLHAKPTRDAWTPYG